MRALIIFLASVCYVGYIPVASGTFGSLVAIPMFWGFDSLRVTSVPLYVLTYLGAVAAACWIAGLAEIYLQEHDSHKIVIDEVVGYLAATMFLQPTWMHTLVAFVIFRGLDVIKPFPADYIDKYFPGGYGVVLDDVVSSIYTNLLVQLLILVRVMA
jgi:phosphatidylglycerophosphatase A